MRANPVISSGAHVRLSSRKLSSSTSSVMTAYMSKNLFWSGGTSCSIVFAPCLGARAGAFGGASVQSCGRYER